MPKILQCHSKGDKRFSAFYAKIKVKGKYVSIENFYQNAKKDKNGNIAGKGNPFCYLEIFNKIIPKEYCSEFYLLLWVQYFLENPELYKFACEFDDYLDIFKGKSLNTQEDAIRKCCKEGLIKTRATCKDLEDLLASKENIPTITKDIFDSKENIIAHQTNCMGVMGTGIALSIKNNYPIVFKKYKNYCDIEDKSEILGTTQIVEITKNKYVANVFGQYMYGRSSRQTNYEALEKALKSLKEYALNNNLSIAIPYKIGCNNAGGDWNIVEKMISKIFYEDKKVAIILYKFKSYT